MDTVEATLKGVGWWRRSLAKKFVENFKKTLQPGEDILGMCAEDMKPSHQLYITNKRVISLTLHNLIQKEESIPINQVTSVDMTLIAGVYSEIEVHSINKTLKIRRVPMKIAIEIRNMIEAKIL
jgi:hypothetical protein